MTVASRYATCCVSTDFGLGYATVGAMSTHGRGVYYEVDEFSWLGKGLLKLGAPPLEIGAEAVLLDGLVEIRTEFIGLDDTDILGMARIGRRVFINLKELAAADSAAWGLGQALAEAGGYPTQAVALALFQLAWKLKILSTEEAKFLDRLQRRVPAGFNPYGAHVQVTELAPTYADASGTDDGTSAVIELLQGLAERNVVKLRIDKSTGVVTGAQLLW